LQQFRRGRQSHLDAGIGRANADLGGREQQRCVVIRHASGLDVRRRQQ